MRFKNASALGSPSLLTLGLAVELNDEVSRVSTNSVAFQFRVDSSLEVSGRAFQPTTTRSSIAKKKEKSGMEVGGQKLLEVKVNTIKLETVVGKGSNRTLVATERNICARETGVKNRRAGRHSFVETKEEEETWRNKEGEARTSKGSSFRRDDSQSGAIILNCISELQVYTSLYSDNLVDQGLLCCLLKDSPSSRSLPLVTEDTSITVLS
ncbi:hypothetical protein ElyMa_007010900 [Elysia marginata]|uniref:Uncharacterized protein n=1 Tax=Elysia marginata TaxID=1093978 RepID=A0AAV4JRZ1_9GAST|nr:hypothetical protein ElyMa_007010900 [Elysia marginata]